MHFGEPLDDERLDALLRPGDGIDTVITADAYGAGEADAAARPRARRASRRDALLARRRRRPRLLRGRARRGAKGYPALHRPASCAARTGTRTTCGWRRSARSSASAPTRFDLLLLHNPDRTGYTQRGGVGGDGARCATTGSTRALGVAPGPANGFTLDVIDCLERFGEIIDWAMVILNPLEPWPGELVLPAAERHGVKVITPRRRLRRAVLRRRPARPRLRRADHRSFRPDGWIERGRERLEQMRPIAERHGLTPLQLACAWNLAHAPVRLRRADADPGARPRREADRGQAGRARGGPRGGPCSSATRSSELRAIGDNTG